MQYKICNWCGGDSIITRIIWGFDVCAICEKNLREYIQEIPTKVPDWIMNYPDPYGVETMVFYIRCSICGHPGPTGTTVAEAIESFCKEGGAFKQGLAQCANCSSKEV